MKTEVTITVSGPVGSGKSALCGEIEIMCRALGLQVRWSDDGEKNMTGADWTTALELYKPTVTIVESIAAPEAPAPHIDDAAVDEFAKAMKQKLARSRDKGRGGWETCHSADLSRMLREHVEKGDPLDVANFCMFLWALGHGIAPASVSEPDREASQQAPEPQSDPDVADIIAGELQTSRGYAYTLMAEALKAAAPEAPEPTMDDAIAAGDGTLHGAIDHWQARALKAESALAAHHTAQAEATQQEISFKYAEAFSRGHDAGWASAMAHEAAQANKRMSRLTDEAIQSVHDHDACLPDLVGRTSQWPEILRFARAIERRCAARWGVQLEEPK
jgi:hypothetical protein